jgi:hypothetical protein
MTPQEMLLPEKQSSPQNFPKASQYRDPPKNAPTQIDVTQPAQTTQAPLATQPPTTITVSSESASVNPPKEAKESPNPPVDPRIEVELK